MKKNLFSLFRLDIYVGDVMHFNMEQLFPAELRKEWGAEVPDIRVVANLPFNVSTPLIVKVRFLISHAN
jgi:dimethyladenosine transferase 1